VLDDMTDAVAAAPFMPAAAAHEHADAAGLQLRQVQQQLLIRVRSKVLDF
jgi:hypothetical protein